MRAFLAVSRYEIDELPAFTVTLVTSARRHGDLLALCRPASNLRAGIMMASEHGEFEARVLVCVQVPSGLAQYPRMVSQFSCAAAQHDSEQPAGRGLNRLES